MVIGGLIATFLVGLLCLVFGAGFLGFLLLAGSVGSGVYLGVKHPRMLKL
jgi:hypothetical protein